MWNGQQFRWPQFRLMFRINSCIYLQQALGYLLNTLWKRAIAGHAITLANIYDSTHFDSNCMLLNLYAETNWFRMLFNWKELIIFLEHFRIYTYIRVANRFIEFWFTDKINIIHIRNAIGIFHSHIIYHIFFLYICLDLVLKIVMEAFKDTSPRMIY